MNFSEALGKTVGDKVRFEEVGSRSTKLWYLTEDVVTRKLLAGNALPGVKAIILDEFHEQHGQLKPSLSQTLLAGNGNLMFG